MPRPKGRPHPGRVEGDALTVGRFLRLGFRQQQFLLLLPVMGTRGALEAAGYESPPKGTKKWQEWASRMVGRIERNPIMKRAIRERDYDVGELQRVVAVAEMARVVAEMRVKLRDGTAKEKVVAVEFLRKHAVARGLSGLSLEARGSEAKAAQTLDDVELGFVAGKPRYGRWPEKEHGPDGRFIGGSADATPADLDQDEAPEADAPVALSRPSTPSKEDGRSNGALTGYCMKCRAKRPIENGERQLYRNGVWALTGRCSVCGTGLTRMLGKGA